jgi:hypothetical protein
MTLSVIPAKAGIHNRYDRDGAEMLRFWIPACAGMTMMGGAAR